MPFLRFSRDKRGYEHFYLVEPTTRRGKSRNRILYWFRTPPGVKVGRLPFDDQVRHALETRYPNVAFDWQKLIDTPIPPPAPDVERWRERRRLERAAKQAAASEAATETVDGASEQPEPPGADPAAPDPLSPAPAAPVVAGADAASQPARRRRRRSGRRGRKSSDTQASNGVDAPRTSEDTTPPNGADSPEPDED